MHSLYKYITMCKSATINPQQKQFLPFVFCLSSQIRVKRCGQVVTAPASYLGDPKFETHLTHSKKIPDYNIKTDYCFFLPHFLLFIIHMSSYHLKLHSSKSVVK
jgi:hypothetical protein